MAVGSINKDFEKQHILNTARVNRQMERLLLEMQRELAAILNTYDLGKPRFKQRDTHAYRWQKGMKAQIDEVLRAYRFNAKQIITQSQSAEWALSNEKNAEIFNFYTKGIDVPTEIIRTAGQLNLDALRAFSQRQVDGISLSNRIWKMSKLEQRNVELYLGSGIGQGKSAVRIAWDLDQLDHGRNIKAISGDEKILIKNARNVSFNALRLAATETNMAYRASDWTRRRQLPFVKGIRVQLSVQHPRQDICDAMQGPYPAGFQFIGWHPLCICFTTAILQTKAEFISSLRTGANPIGIVTGIPDEARAYMTSHYSAVRKTYFFRDNFVPNTIKSKSIKMKDFVTQRITYSDLAA